MGPALLPENLQVFPNPFAKELNIGWVNLKKGTLGGSVYGLDGRLIDQLENSDNGRIVWNAAGYSGGIYVLKITAGNRNYLRKILLQR